MSSPELSELQPLARLSGDTDCLLQGHPVVGGVLDDTFHIPATLQLGDHVGLVLLLAQVEDRHDVGMGAQPPHSLGLSLDAAAARSVQPLGLDYGERYVPVQKSIVGQVDFLLAAFTQASIDLVSSIGEGGGVHWSCR